MLRNWSSSRISATSAAGTWSLGNLPGRAAVELEQWLDDIGALTLEEWRSIGRDCMRDDPSNRARLAANMVLEQIVARHGLPTTAWFVRDLVETATHGIRMRASGASRSVRSDLARAISAANSAALALATQDWLPPGDRNALLAPFRRPTSPSALRLS
jgi:hypothetical protein